MLQLAKLDRGKKLASSIQSKQRSGFSQLIIIILLYPLLFILVVVLRAHILRWSFDATCRSGFSRVVLPAPRVWHGAGEPDQTC